MRPLRVLAVFVVLGGAAYFLYATLPSSFVPQEDQGVLTTQISLPVGANVLLFANRYRTLQAETTAAIVTSTSAFLLTGTLWLLLLGAL